MRQRFVIDFDDKVGAVGFHAFAFCGFERDEAGDLNRDNLQGSDQLANPIVGKLHVQN